LAELLSSVCQLFQHAYQSLGMSYTGLQRAHERQCLQDGDPEILRGRFSSACPHHLALFTIAAREQTWLLGVQVFCGILGLLMMINACGFLQRQGALLRGRGLRARGKGSLKASVYETMKCAPFRLKLLPASVFRWRTA